MDSYDYRNRRSPKVPSAVFINIKVKTYTDIWFGSRRKFIYLPACACMPYCNANALYMKS